MNHITKLFTLTICLALCAGTSAQVRTVTFTGRDRTNQYHIPLHHVNVFNLDQLWEEVLVYPDTTLTMGTVGIGEHELPSGLRLMQNVPNPFDGTTEFVLILPTDNDVTLEIYDISGKLTVSRKFGTLPAGSHLFRATLMAPQTYLLGATTRDGQTTIKMVNEGHGGENSIQHIGMTDANGDFTLYLKDEKVSSNYPFHNGDEMHYIGYAKIDGNMLENDTSLRQYFYDTIPLIPFKFDVTIPTVIITTISVDLYSATCTGEVTDNGGSPVSSRGVCWSMSPNPTVGDNVIPSNSGGIGNFTSNITGLIPNTTYHVRAYATNSVGTAYSEDTTFTTLCNSVNVSVSGNTTINYGESTTLTASGASSYQWSTGATTASITVSPTASTIYTVTGTNSYGCTASASVTMTVNPIAPIVTTDSVSDITDNAVFCWGNVISDGGANVTIRGFCFSNINPVPNYVSDSHPEAGFGVGNFSKNITGLLPNTTYHVRAYAINSVDTAYGDTVSFKTDCNVVTINISGNTTIDYGDSTTLTASGASSYQWSTGATTASITVSPTDSTIYTVTGTNSYGCTATASVIVTVNPIAPTVTTDSVSGITDNAVFCWGNVISDGGANVTKRGFCYSYTNPVPNFLSDSHPEAGSGVGDFSKNIAGLRPNTTYHVRAYAINSVDTSYGETVSFTTLCDDVDTTVFVTTCDSYTWNGITYTASGEYVRTFQKANGCDSTVRLNLTISHSDAVAVDTVVFENDLPFEWNGVTFTEAGTQSVTLWNVWGCDSVVAMTLIVPVIDEKSCPAAPTVTDHEGNVYATVQIGNQCWMRENLRTTHYSDGMPIPAGSDSTSYVNPYYYDYTSSDIPLEERGYLYNWPAAMHGASSSNSNPSGVQGICPVGWHLPSDAEWTALTNYMRSQSEYVCGDTNINIAKALADSVGWYSSTNNCAVGNNQSANNATGFSAVPAGTCVGSSIYYAGYDATFWSATQGGSGYYAFARNLGYDCAGVLMYWGLYKSDGRSVRCLRDAGTAVVDEKTCAAAPTVTDHEGNVYATVQIGNQCWMRDNLRTTTSPSTGTRLIPDTNATYSYTGKQARWYDNDSATYAPMNYGLLYNWNAAVDIFNTAYGETIVNTDYNNAVSVMFNGHRRGICPVGWHLPSDEEWTALTDYVGGVPEYQCGGSSSNIAKALASETGWNSYGGECYPGDQSQHTNNATGFSAVPAGRCSGSSFFDADTNAGFWSSTQIASYPYDAYYRRMYYGDANVYRDSDGKYYGWSVRCLRDAGTAVVDEKSCSAAPTVTDHEGNVYATVQIGNQCWMRDNLRTTTSPSTGTYLIPPDTAGSTYTGKQARWYNNDSATYAPQNYGLLYNWNAAVDTFNIAETDVNTNSSYAVSVTFSGHRRGICPTGWHLPSAAEWTQLTNYVSNVPEYQCGDSSSYIAKALASETGWNSWSGECYPGDQSQHTNNATGFSAVPAGRCLSSSFYYAADEAYFWSAAQNGRSWAYYYNLARSNTGVGRGSLTKNFRFSVRCLRDAGTAVVDSKPCPVAPTVTDHEGNVYATVQIGNQCWMRENLRTTHYSDGTPIPNGGGNYSPTEPYYYDYSSSGIPLSVRGYLYNWPAAMVACPTGWHLPSDAEWNTMERTVSGSDWQTSYETTYGWRGNHAGKLAGGYHWQSSTMSGAPGDYYNADHNVSGFSAVPAGSCTVSSFNYAGNYADFWCATQYSSDYAYGRSLYYSDPGVYRNYYFKNHCRSVRCLRDAGTAVVDEKSCSTAPTVTDHEGNVYATVQIGNQCWMRDNLRTTTSPNTGTYLIPPDTAGYTYTGKQARWYYNDSATYAPQNYGLLYNWNAAVDTFNTDYGETSVNDSDSNAKWMSFNGYRRGICPAGWHLPSDAEWTMLTSYMYSQSEYVCGDTNINIAKALADNVCWWRSSTTTCAVGNNQSANNATGFSAVPAGTCFGSLFANAAGAYANFWSATQGSSNNAYYRYLYCGNAGVLRNNDNKYDGFSVRCLRDAGNATIGEKVCPVDSTVTDHEGNVYATVQIGNQCWMRENLRTTTSPSTGTYLIPPDTAGYTLTGKQARWYDNDSARYAPMNYGLLYNWNAAVDTFNTDYGETSVNDSGSNAKWMSFNGYRRGICPAGWHLPSDAEWTVLTSYMYSQSEYVCGDTNINIAKALTDSVGWHSSTTTCAVGNNQSTNNATGFSVVPAGRHNGSSFSNAGISTSFWSSTVSGGSQIYAYERYLYCYGTDVGRTDHFKALGFSVRCLRD